MTDCKNCEMTDEYCASGDCPNDKTLNEQWCEGTLPRDKYYYAKDCGKDCIVQIDKSNDLFFSGWEVPYHPDQSNKLEPFKLSTELLAEVPSFDEWKAAYESQLMESELVLTLKKLLRECSMYIDWRTDHYIIDGHDRKQELFDAISEALK